MELTSRVYQYGTVPSRVAPVLGEEAATFQLRLANRLWNTLVAIERVRIARYRRIMRDEAQERIEVLKQQMTAAREEIKTRRKAVRKRGVDIADMQAIIDATRAQLHAILNEQKATSAARHDAKRIELSALSERTKHRIKRARQAAGAMGLFWGSYNDIVQRADTGRKAGDLQFRRYTGDGTLTAQIIGGATVMRAINGDHTFFQTQAIPGQRWHRARMRIGSTPDRQPVWLDIPIILHREIPASAMIKSVSMTRRHGKWTVNITVNLPAVVPHGIGPRVAIDVGYRLKPEGVRVAYWADTEGASGEVVVRGSDLEQLTKVRSLRSTCDRMRDEFLPSLVEWLRDRELSPEWQQHTTALAQWRSTDRLAGLIRWWADNRLTDDAEIFAAAHDWRQQYLHLANWWRNLDDQIRLRIREQYRVFAAGVARRYGGVFIEEFDLREVAEKPNPESDEVRTAAATNRQMVSPSVFRHALVNACRRDGVEVIKLPAEYTTRICHVCWESGKWDQAENIMHRCAACGSLWDQDYNAAINLLEMGLARGGVALTENQPVRPRKWDRVRNRSQKPVETVESTEVIA